MDCEIWAPSYEIKYEDIIRSSESQVEFSFNVIQQQMLSFTFTVVHNKRYVDMFLDRFLMTIFLGIAGISILHGRYSIDLYLDDKFFLDIHVHKLHIF